MKKSSVLPGGFLFLPAVLLVFSLAGCRTTPPTGFLPEFGAELGSFDKESTGKKERPPYRSVRKILLSREPGSEMAGRAAEKTPEAVTDSRLRLYFKLEGWLPEIGIRVLPILSEKTFSPEIPRLLWDGHSFRLRPPEGGPAGSSSLLPLKDLRLEQEMTGRSEEPGDSSLVWKERIASGEEFKIPGDSGETGTGRLIRVYREGGLPPGFYRIELDVPDRALGRGGAAAGRFYLEIGSPAPRDLIRPLF